MSNWWNQMLGGGKGLGDALQNGLSDLPTLREADILEGYCAHKIPVNIDEPRGIILAPSDTATSDLLVLEKGREAVTLLRDTDFDNVIDDRLVVAKQKGLNHGLAWHDGYLYASSSDEVFRWPYPASGDIDEQIEEDPEVVIFGLSQNGRGGEPAGRHFTRSLGFDSDGIFYVQCGSVGNIDRNSFRARIRTFNLTGAESSFPINYTSGEIFADGVRNTLGFDWDRHGVLWGVDMGADSLIRDDLARIGGDIHNENPGDELNKLTKENAGKFYGYPYCWSEFNLGDEGMGRGSQWAWPRDNDEVQDGWCRDRDNNIGPEISFQAHESPMGITFYNYQESLPQQCNPDEAFPQSMDGNAFVTFHGSWNRIISVGYNVQYIRMDSNGNVRDEGPRDFLKHNGRSAVWGDGFRPVDVVFDKCGRLYISSDGPILGGSPIPYSRPGSQIVQMVRSNQCPSGNDPRTIGVTAIFIKTIQDILVGVGIFLSGLFGFPDLEEFPPTAVLS